MITRTIFIVEDEKDHLELLKLVLEQNRFSVLSTSSGDKAVPLITQMTPDLVILDVMLPGLNGFEICKALRANPATAALPVIILTARSARADVEAGTQAGANLYVKKPFDADALITQIRSLLSATSQPV